MNQEIIETPEVLQLEHADEKTYQSLQDYARLIRRNCNKSTYLDVPVRVKSTSFYLQTQLVKVKQNIMEGEETTKYALVYLAEADSIGFRVELPKTHWFVSVLNQLIKLKQHQDFHTSPTITALVVDSFQLFSKLSKLTPTNPYQKLSYSEDMIETIKWVFANTSLKMWTMSGLDFTKILQVKVVRENDNSKDGSYVRQIESQYPAGNFVVFD